MKMLIARKRLIETIISTPINCYSPVLNLRLGIIKGQFRKYHRPSFGIFISPLRSICNVLLAFFAVKVYLQFVTNTEDRQYKPHFPKNSYVW